MRMEAARRMGGACPCPARPGRAAGVRLALPLPLLALVLMLPPSVAHAQTITSVTPARQRVHELLAVTGSGFGSFSPGADRVEFSDGTVAIAAGAPYVWRDGFVQVRVPAGALVAGVPTPLPTGALHVRIVKGAATSNAVPFQVLAGLDGFLPPFSERTQIGPEQTDVSTVLGNPNLNLARTKDGEVGDVDGDGLPDLIDNNSNNQTNGTHSVLRINQGDGTFSAIALEPNDAAEASDPAAGPFATQIPPGGTFVENLGTYDADLVDLDNDGLPELVQAYAQRLGPAEMRRVRVLRNLGAGAFLEATPTWLPAPSFPGEPDDVAHTDIDHDGFVDIAFAQRGSPIVTVLRNESGLRFAPQIDLSIKGVFAFDSVHDVFFLDANADGYPDLIGVNDKNLAKLLLSQSGTFAPEQAGQTIDGSLQAFSGASADLDGDGLDDFVLAGTGGVRVYRNRRENPGTFERTDVGLGSFLFYDVELGDVNLDGTVDIVIARILESETHAVVVLLNHGDGSFENATPLPLGATALLPTLGAFQRLSADLLDLDRDGDLDLYVTGADGLEGELFPFGRAPNQLFENELLQRGSCDVNADGRIDAADVLLAARIAGGSLTATPAMLARADVAPAKRRPTDGVVTAADVLIVARAAKGDPIVVCSPAAVTP